MQIFNIVLFAPQKIFRYFKKIAKIVLKVFGSQRPS